MLVNCHFRPPDMRFFAPSFSAWPSSNPRRRRLPASIAHIMPAAPAPTIATSALTAPAPRSPDHVQQYQQNDDAGADPDPDRQGEFFGLGGVRSIRLRGVRRYPR